MKLLLVNLVFFLTFFLCLQEVKGKTRTTIQSLNIRNQLRCVGISFPEKFLHYGCWCGPFNTKGRTLDALDACCKEHDKCFNRLKSKTRPVIGPTVYRVKCKKRKNKCKKFGIFNRNFPKKVCDCDRRFAECVQRNKRVYRIGNTLSSSERKRRCR